MNQPDYFGIPTDFPSQNAWAFGQDNAGYWQAFKLYEQVVIFRWIPKGRFTMGSAENEAGRYDFEDRHKVTLTQGFWLAEIPVTQALWLAVMKHNPSKFETPEPHLLPVESVSWDDVQEFLKKLNQDYADLKVRLPYEAEWEYACRAGTETAFSFGAELTLQKANYSGIWDEYGLDQDAEEKTTAVTRYLANPWGLYDMHGNVWEWCQDAWQRHLGIKAVTDPWVDTTKTQEKQGAGFRRVLHGGSWSGKGRDLRSAMRGRDRPDGRSYDLGFRLSLGLLSSSKE